MKTIVQARESLSKLWGNPKPKDTVYRLMKYLLRAKVNDGLLLHNNVTGHMVLLTQDEAKQLSKLPTKPTELIKELISYHFLVPEDFDEYKSVNQLRKIYRNRSTGDFINHYVILPTTFCNAHCFYCYESDYPRIQMTEETAHKLVNYIDEHRKEKEVSLGWFGGEPLVGIARIDQISRELTDREIPFAASMISNGYLFDEEIVKRAKSLWNLKRVQITLDGPEEVYNRVKAYANVKDNPYQRVLKNIDQLSLNDIRVNIRLNVDFYNQDDIRTLIEELSERYSGNKNIGVYLNILFNNQGFEPVQHSIDEIVSLLNLIADYTKRLKELKIAYDDLKLPSLQVSQCMADNQHSVQIQPDGSFCRCEHENILDSYGNIDQGILDPQKILKWTELIERSDHCSECAVYPHCYQLRHCMSADTPCIESLRLSNLKAYEDKMILVYQKSLEGTENEKV